MKLLLLLIISSVSHLIFSGFLSYEQYWINISLVVAIELALLREKNTAVMFSFLSGLIEDIFFFGITGSNSLVKTIVSYICGFFKGRFAVNNIIFQFVLVFCMSVFYSISIHIIRIIFYQPYIFSTAIFINALLNALIAPFVYALIDRYYGG